MVRVLIVRAVIVRVLTISIEMISVLTTRRGGCPIEACSGVDKNGRSAQNFFPRVHYTGSMFSAMYASRTHCRNRVSGLL